MPKFAEPFLLSNSGSTRATSYSMGNKVVTLDSKTHVVWLDAVSEIRGRTFDHETHEWSETFHLGTGADNHANPVLTADAERRLHLVYGPHGWWGNWNYGRFKHSVSLEPNSMEAWDECVDFGYNATYASMVSTPLGLDCVVYRGGEYPPCAMFQRQNENGGWTNAMPLMIQDVPPQYTHWGAKIVCDRDGTLYVAAHFYNKDAERSNGVAIIKSETMGESWTGLAGEKLETPITYDKRFAIPHDPNPDADIRLAGLALDPDGALWAATSGRGTAWLSCWTGDEWEVVDMARFMPPGRSPKAGPILVDASGAIHMAVDLPARDAQGETWGHKSHEIFYLFSSDLANSFECNQVSQPDPEIGNWQPSISLPGPFHDVARPVILYTHGVPGQGCSPQVKTDVYCVMVNESR